MSDKYIRAIRRMALDGLLDAKAIENMLNARDAGRFVESEHPRGKGGRFVTKGSGTASSGGSETTSGTAAPTKPKMETTKLIEHQKKKYPRKIAATATIPERVAAAKITRLGDESIKSRVAESNSGGRFASKPGEMREGKKFHEGSAFNNPKMGGATRNLQNGSGATRLSPGDIYSEKRPNQGHSINQYLDDNGNLTPEREALHQQAIDNIFAGKKPKGPGEKKTFTMFGGGSAAGKGGLSNPNTHNDFGTPSKDDVATIDADELKKDLPEYREMQETNPDEAAAYAHEESSALAKRAMEAAIANGYDYTLDGTGDGSVDGVLKKIKQARDAGYEVNACYVTCPTELAVERSIERGKRTKRNVPLDRVRGIHEAVSEIFPQVASQFDHVTLYDTNQPKGEKPKLIAECFRGGEIKVHDQKLYDAFLAKSPANRH